MILTLDSSSKTASVALIDDGKILYSSFLNDGRTHSQKLMPQVDECFKATGFLPKDIDSFAAVIGPGSFTGLRIGVATIQGIAYSMKKECIALNTLDVLAHNISHFDGLIVPLIDARNAQAYCAVYDCTRNYKKVMDDMAKKVSEIAQDVKKLGKNAFFLGDGATINRNIIEDIMEKNAFFAPQNMNYQNAQTASILAQIKYDKGETIPPDKLIPYYYRQTSAKKKFKST